jgi:hypothetical protein
MAVVFISYAKEDTQTADAVCGTLEAAGLSCWVAPRDLPPGSTWGKAIVEAIGSADAMVVILSPHANASRHVPREVNQADGLNLPVIPLLVEAVQLSGDLEYLLKNRQWIDAVRPPLEANLASLAEAVQALVRTSKPTASNRPARRNRQRRSAAGPGPAEIRPPAPAASPTGARVFVRPAATRIFVSYSDSSRDGWIESQLFPILHALGLKILHGKDFRGVTLASEVKDRITQADALLGFLTLRDADRESARTHPWIADEVMFAMAIGKPVLEVCEQGVSAHEGLAGAKRRLVLDQADRLRCVSEVIRGLKEFCVRTLQLVPGDERLLRRVLQEHRDPEFAVRYRTRANGLESPYRMARLEEFQGALSIQILDIPDDGLVEVEGAVRDRPIFRSGWQPVHAVAPQIPVR